MQILHTPAELRAALGASRDRVLVPTMGNLHAGHLALVARARELGAPVIASVFVNRLQFGPNEDFDRYPRTLDHDADLLREAGCDMLFAPAEHDMYPQPQTWRVQPDPVVAGVLDGAARPGHFEGVATVVMKLLQMAQPRWAVFGKKDYQQWRLIRAMAAQFALAVDIEGVETVRAADGLALSSRNAYLDPRQRAQAPQLHRTLWHVAELVRSNPVDPARLPEIEQAAAQDLRAQGWEPDYVSVRRRDDLQPPTEADLRLPGTLVVLGAARLGGTRLIDNLEF